MNSAFVKKFTNEFRPTYSINAFGALLDTKVNSVYRPLF